MSRQTKVHTGIFVLNVLKGTTQTVFLSSTWQNLVPFCYQTTFRYTTLTITFYIKRLCIQTITKIHLNQNASLLQGQESMQISSWTSHQVIPYLLFHSPPWARSRGNPINPIKITCLLTVANLEFSNFFSRLWLPKGRNTIRNRSVKIFTAFLYRQYPQKP